MFWAVHVQHSMHVLRVQAQLATSPAEQPLPVFDLSPALEHQAPGSNQPNAEVEALAHQLATCLQQTGCLVIRDPRVQMADNETFLNMMERYFGQSMEAKLADVRSELHYQVRLLLQWKTVHRTVCMQASPCRRACFLPGSLCITSIPF